MAAEDGWTEVARRKRRLGIVTEDGNEQGRWVGVSGLLRTTAEKLVSDGAWRDENAVSSDGPLAHDLADLRHVLGGTCVGVTGQKRLQGCLDMCERSSEK